MISKEMFYKGQVLSKDEFINKTKYNFLHSNYKKKDMKIALMKYDNGEIIEKLVVSYLENKDSIIIKSAEYSLRKKTGAIFESFINGAAMSVIIFIILLIGDKLLKLY